MRVRGARRTAIGVIAVLASSAAILPQARAQSGDWHAAVRSLLDRRAAAVSSGDRRAFDDTMRFAPASFQTDKDTWFARLRALPLGSYALVPDPDGYDDLVSGLVSRPAADEVHVVTMIERISFKGFDEAPSADDVYLTVIRKGSVWSLYGDQGLEPIGLLSVRNAWDFAPVEQLSRSGVLMLYQDDRSTASRILQSTLSAIAFDKKRWPLVWRQSIVVAIPKSTHELSRILQTTFDLGPFVAFSASSLYRPSGRYELTGNRVYVQPGTFFSTPPAFQEDTMSHELLHVATRDYAGAFTPSWLDEGVAQDYGQRSLPGLGDLSARVSSGTFTGLPEDFDFFVGSDTGIHLSYEAASSFIEYLIGRFGRSAGARLYRAMGRETPDSFGTARYHLDHAAHAAFGVGIDDLERGWTQKLRREFGS